MSNHRTSWWVGLGALLLLAACAGNTPAAVSPESVNEHPAAASESDADVVAPGEAKVGDKTRCLVSGHTFTVDEESPKVEYEGKTYYFCCPGCDGKFSADPAKYVKGST